MVRPYASGMTQAAVETLMPNILVNLLQFSLYFLEDFVERILAFISFFALRGSLFLPISYIPPVAPEVSRK